MTTTEKNVTTEKPQPSVTDKNGKTWPLVLTVNLLKPLEDLLQHHPRELLTSPERLIQFLADPEKVAKVAYLFTEPVPPAIPKASEEEFAAALDSDALDQAAEATIRLVAGMYAPRGRKEEVADTLINFLKQASQKANPQSEPTEPPAQTAA